MVSRSAVADMQSVEMAGGGWEALIARVCSVARSAAPDASVVLDVLLTMDGTIPRSQGLESLPSESRGLVEALCAVPCVAVAPDPAVPAEGPAIFVGLAACGRPVFSMSPLVDGTLSVAQIRAATDVGERALLGAAATWRAVRAADRVDRARLAAWLGGKTREQILQSLSRIEYVLLHMAPLRLYVGDECFTNLGKGNLPGRSLNVDDEASLLRRLRDEPVDVWSDEEAVFVAISWILLHSGTQARLEEANGTCVDLRWLHDFLTAKATDYRLRDAPPGGEPDPEALLAFAGAIAQRRREMVQAGRVFYRDIHGVNLRKAERLLDAVPSAGTLSALSRSSKSWRNPATSTQAMGQIAARAVAVSEVHERPAARARVLQEILLDIAEATSSDAVMARGPRDLFFVGGDESRDPLSLSTTDFYCCVVPGDSFAQSFDGREADLVKTLSAYSARMRFNSWHYLPDVLGLSEGKRDDWFFAPTMPDMTRHSEWHHTGHVRFGVRYAIRIPLWVTLAGRDFPGLYDLRLMRATGEPFTTCDLEAAIAFGQVLRAYHEEVYELCREPVEEFDNAWFRSTYAR